MADDIVTRLRHLAEYDYDNVGAGNAMLIAAAADEIERLRAAGDALVNVAECQICNEFGLNAHINQYTNVRVPCALDAAVEAWEEARRG